MFAGGSCGSFWYYAEGDETRGPIAFDQLIKLLSQLPTPRGVLVWREGLTGWTAAENVREIVEKLIRPPPLRPASSAVAPTVTDDTVTRYQQQFKKDTPVDDETVARYQQQFQKSKSELTLQPELTGLGGWLGLLGFGLVAGMLKALVKTRQSWSLVDANAFRQFPAFAYGGLILDLAWLLLFVCTIAMFFSRSRKFPPLFIGLLITSILMPFIIVIWARLFLRGGFEIAQLFGQEEVAQMIVGFIGAALWIPYILKSKRVANTFVK